MKKSDHDSVDNYLAGAAGVRFFLIIKKKRPSIKKKLPQIGSQLGPAVIPLAFFSLMPNTRITAIPVSRRLY